MVLEAEIPVRAKRKHESANLTGLPARLGGFLLTQAPFGGASYRRRDEMSTTTENTTSKVLPNGTSKHGGTQSSVHPSAQGPEVLTGSQITCRALEAEGVDIVFGYPGGAVIPLYDALPSAGFHHVLTRFEQWAALAADGYARATGKVGVCIATSGPGATNLVTGLANSQLDSVPVVAITGQVGQAMIGLDAFQETDITGITLPITKHNYLVQSVEDIAPTIREAFHLARSGRPGPVLRRHSQESLSGDCEIRTRRSARSAWLSADHHS